MNVDDDITWDYHQAFIVGHTGVTFHAPINMQQQKITNVLLDKSIDDSVATVKMVKDYTTNNTYKEIFEHFYDFSDASNYKLTTGVSGITFTGINPNSTFP